MRHYIRRSVLEGGCKRSGDGGEGLGELGSVGGKNQLLWKDIERRGLRKSWREEGREGVGGGERFENWVFDRKKSFK